MALSNTKWAANISANKAKQWNRNKAIVFLYERQTFFFSLSLSLAEARVVGKEFQKSPTRALGKC